eukprot:TRINITY_DN101193_c0_g1_i1.p1 TRINITY_DN101193_c0_g1~~TRINITY_DN101193_c0_g1_i1.p1  ORF type:complete len:448 (+),score=127.50 TRINITY_DN101193_c0_g1_i1:107-1345(+)
MVLGAALSSSSAQNFVAPSSGIAQREPAGRLLRGLASESAALPSPLVQAPTAGVQACAAAAVAALVGGAAVTARRAAKKGGRASRAVRCAEARDAVTGTKFEEEDESKNPQRRPGHQVKGMPQVDPETAAKQQKLREHQEGCQRLSWPEEIRGIMAQKLGFAVISTVARKGSIKDFPSGSIVGFATDEKGRPFFSFSGMSSHTGNLMADSRASLCVTEPDFTGAADARVVLTGRVEQLPDGEEADALRERYILQHPNAYWAKFGDFKMFRMNEILDVGFVGGFARAGGITPEEYMAADPDPCLAFSEPVMAHMNDDHAESIKGYVKYLVGVESVEEAKMKRLDRYGFDCRVKSGGQWGVLRVPFDEPITERSKIKDAIVGLSKKAAKIKQELEAAEPAAAPPAAESAAVAKD